MPSTTVPSGARTGTTLLALAVGTALVTTVLVPAGSAAAAAVPPVPPGLPSGVEDLQPYVGQLGCDPVAKPGVLAFQALLLRTYPDTGSAGIERDCSLGGQSEHKEGRAFDWAVSTGNARQVAEVQALTSWLTAPSGPVFAANARRLGLMYMIWDQQIWEAYRPAAGWHAYTGSDPHTSHVHFSFGWNGALGHTSWWTRRVAPLEYGPWSTDRPSAPVPPPVPPAPPAPPPPPAATPIDLEHQAMGGDGGVLGAATGPEVDVQGGRYRPYTAGAVYWSAATGAHEVHGDIWRRYSAAGGSRSALGLPTSDELAVPGGRGNTFQGGWVAWSPLTAAHAVYGAIGDAYRAAGGPASVLALPTAEETDVADGRAVTFQGGRVDWSATTGAHPVYGAIGDLYRALGAEAGLLALPVTDEHVVSGGRGSDFQGGSVLWSPGTGAHEVHGEIRRAWLAVGGAGSVLGLPTTDEGDQPGGRSNGFSGGWVYWSWVTGAAPVYGAIGQRYVGDGGVSAYGYPLAAEQPAPGGRTQVFERAVLDFDASTLAVTVRSR